MKICGLLKTTLLDYPQKVACTVFTGGCNFSCPYCHNASLVLDHQANEEMTETNFFAFLEKRKGVIDGVCISGGEPIIQKDLIGFIEKIKEKGYEIKLDTNGSDPEKLNEIMKKGLVDYVAMDIKSSPNNYNIAIGKDNIDIDKIKESVNILKKSHINFEFRTTLVKGIHTKKDIEEIGKWLNSDVKYYLQNYNDSGDTIASRIDENDKYKAFSEEEMAGFIEIMRQHVPKTSIRGD